MVQNSSTSKHPNQEIHYSKEKKDLCFSFQNAKIIKRLSFDVMYMQFFNPAPLLLLYNLKITSLNAHFCLKSKKGLNFNVKVFWERIRKSSMVYGVYCI